MKTNVLFLLFMSAVLAFSATKGPAVSSSTIAVSERKAQRVGSPLQEESSRIKRGFLFRKIKHQPLFQKVWFSQKRSWQDDDPAGDDLLAIMGIVSSGLALMSLLIFPPLSLVFGVVGWILGARAKKRGQDPTLSQIAIVSGIVTGAIGLIITGLLVALVLVAFL